MNPQLIKKVIKSSNETCPELVYKNPLLDPKVTKALAKSFVKILTSKQSTSVNKSLRLAVLENIRKICKLEPEGHTKLHENHRKLLIDVYKQSHLSKTGTYENDERLTAFLTRTFTDLDFKTNESVTVNPETIQALFNLDLGNSNFISDNIIHWNIDEKCQVLLNNIWNQDRTKVDDVVIKLKSEIETMLLNLCHKSLEEQPNKIDFDGEPYSRLFKTCAVSPTCFQICSSILNAVFISTNYDSQIHNLITKFVSIVRNSCRDIAFPSLYHADIGHVVILLDIDVNIVPILLREKYVSEAVNYLNNIKIVSHSNFVLLLSHFPQWFSLS